MKHTVIIEEDCNLKIDWSKPMWVKSDDMIILTNGESTMCNFSGTCLPCSNYPDGHYSTQWSKKVFIPIKELTIKISN